MVTLDALRANRPELGFAVYALEPGGRGFRDPSGVCRTGGKSGGRVVFPCAPKPVHVDAPREDTPAL
ncbi:hypothetical protein [Haematospirillum jordaniae]|uniref:Uncharacterized protein n=1 Tax=Haematospirillum jordaniae TaxID=1549855 RepID=A0A143DDU6_9PROT|nr:hypothetical protein [Haematospirillum jordaniae]AMW34875.1 hypothetical protein AY555_06445 [Haematospirillum jordaniae]NKD66667.1 hypothetical protein [Haematospirillum jordaniae]NKD81169.1 hypothetical protein [Haematospirillum jordaniae]NKD85164.1 hypothetical protein [Haematospirillum jordaniae]NKD89463.1 hypothetical protein [Haematospirillum jordaniae]